MTEIVLNTNTLPEPLYRLIKTKKVKVNETNGVVNLIPIAESNAECPLRGLAADSNLTVESFLVLTHDENEIKNE